VQAASAGNGGSSGSQKGRASRATRRRELKPGDTRRIAGDNRFLAQTPGMAATRAHLSGGSRMQGRRRGEGTQKPWLWRFANE